MNGIDPGSWPDVAQKIGLGGAVVLVISIGIAIGFATRGPEWVKAIGDVLNVILTHLRESKRIKHIISQEQKQLSTEFKRLGITDSESAQGSES